MSGGKDASNPTEEDPDRGLLVGGSIRWRTDRIGESVCTDTTHLSSSYLISVRTLKGTTMIPSRRTTKRLLVLERLEARQVLAASIWNAEAGLDHHLADRIRQDYLASEPKNEAAYYDYVENGVLTGGRVNISTLPDPFRTLEKSGSSPSRLNGSGSSTTIVNNGSPANRIDIVIVGDGYQAGQMANYYQHVTNMLPSFFAITPLNEYRTYFNVHRVDVHSIDSGVDNDPTNGVQKNTALDSGFWCSNIERLLCVNVTKAYSFANNAPGVDQVLVLANSTKYGGAGYPANNLGTLSGNNAFSVDVAIHEFGHSFADLADEYEYGGPTTYTGAERPEANVSIYNASQMQSNLTKWHRWLPEANVDAFQGGYYSQFGIYRPTSNSMMRSLGRPFEEVNVEQFIFSMYKTVKPIDSSTAPGTYPKASVFTVTPVVPEASRKIQWFVDGVEQTSATGTSFDTAPLGLATGQYTISARVSDTSSMVRDPVIRDTFMTQQLSWTVKVTAPPTLDPISNRTINEDAGTQTINLTGIGAGAGESEPLRITAASSNPSLIPAPSVTYTSPNPTGSLSFTPLSNQSGQTVITVTVEDGGLDNNLNTATDNVTFRRSFTVTVNPINDAPSDINLSSSSIPENAGANAAVGTLSTTDVDAGNTFTYTLVAGSGSTDNAAFNINGATLRATNSFDFEAKSSYAIRVRSTDQDGLFVEKTFTISVTNVNEGPVLTRSQAAVSGNVLATFTNTGTWSDPEGDTVTLSASLGTVTRNGDGTWSWSFVPSQAYSAQIVTVSGNDGNGNNSQVAFTLDALVAVVNSKVYYKGSTFAGTSVNAALDTSKVIAKSGPAPQTLDFSNLITTNRGINGLVFDVAGLTAASLSESDFVLRVSPTGAFNETANPPSSWVAAPAPSLVNVTAGTATTPARVRLEWADNAIADRWLQVKILANSNTGLVSSQVYYVGHLYGEVNGAISSGTFTVSIADVTAIRPNVGLSVPVTSPFDLDKSGSVSIGDITGMRPRVGIASLRVITIPPSGSANEGEGNATDPRIAAPMIDVTKLGTVTPRLESIVREVRARWTNEIFDVPILASIDPRGAQATPRFVSSLGSDAAVGNAIEFSLPSLEEYFERLGRERSIGVRARRP